MLSSTRSASYPVLSSASLAALAAVSLVAILAAGCGDSEPPVGSVSVDPSTVTLPYPGTRQVDLTWAPEEELDAATPRPRVFVHLLPPDEKEVLRTFDHQLPEAWRPGSGISYPLELHQSMLGPPLPAGTYRLTLGLYERDRRWPLEGGEEAGNREYTVASVEVPAAQPETLPELDYEGDWSPLNAGTDRQVLGFRYIGADATLRISGVPEDGTLGLGLEINPPPPGFDRVAVDVAPTADGGEAGDGGGGDGQAGGDEAGESTDMAAPGEPAAGAAEPSEPGVPALRALVTCNDTEATLSGLGRSDLAVDLTAGTDCAVHLRPNFAHRPAAGQEPDAQEVTELARLVTVTWDPEG